MTTPRTVAVTGAAGGFGALAARALAAAGHTVYAGMRATDGQNMAAFRAAIVYAKEHAVDLRPFEMDVCHQDSVDAAVAEVFERSGCLDVVVHGAGQVVVGPTGASAHLADVQDTAVVSTGRLHRGASRLRVQRGGLLVWIGTAGAQDGAPRCLTPFFATTLAVLGPAHVEAAELVGTVVRVVDAAGGQTSLRRAPPPRRPRCHRRPRNG